MTKPQNMPRAIWEHWPDEPDFIGPNPHIVSIFIILEYVGYRRKDAFFKGHHVYKVRCTQCGKEFERIQDSIKQASRKQILGCVHCTRDRNREKDAEQRARVKAMRVSEFHDWVKLLQTIPPTPLQFRKGFDSERQIKLGIR